MARTLVFTKRWMEPEFGVRRNVTIRGCGVRVSERFKNVILLGSLPMPDTAGWDRWREESRSFMKGGWWLNLTADTGIVKGLPDTLVIVNGTEAAEKFRENVDNTVAVIGLLGKLPEGLGGRKFRWVISLADEELVGKRTFGRWWKKEIAGLSREGEGGVIKVGEEL